MLIILEGLSAAQRRALLPALRRLLGPDARWETVPPHSELFGRPRLERLLTIVSNYGPVDPPLVIDGWILAPIHHHEWAVRADHALRALALARLAQQKDTVLLRGRVNEQGDASRVNLWHELSFIQKPTTCDAKDTERTLREALAETMPLESGDLAAIDARGIGHPRPRIVLVGESPSKNTWLGLPFSGGPAAGLVREALRGYGDVYLLNARGGVGETPPDEELRLLASRTPSPLFIALGVQSGKLLERLKLPHTLLIHPAHVERFKSTEVKTWVAQLRTLLEKR